MRQKGNICVNGTMYIYKRNKVLAAFSMAFYRINISATPFISNIFCKCSINTFKLHLSRRQLSTKSKSGKHERNVTESSTNNKVNTLFQYIQERKSEAQRSIIVQVSSMKSCQNLVSYCSQFGEIANVYFYSIPKEHQFVLLEYKERIAVRNVLNSASYMNKEYIVPSKTNVFWFRKEQAKIVGSNSSNVSRINNYSNYMFFNDHVVRRLLITTSSVPSQMSTLYREYKIKELEIRLKFQIINNIENYFSGIFPKMIVYPFGSFINGFGQKLSDLDVVVFANGRQKDNPSSRLIFHSKAANLDEKQQAHEFMGVLADTMKYMVPGICNVRKIFNARVPIIKFNNIFTHTECDLSMSNIIAIYMSELLFLYGELDDRIRPLVFTIRRWAHDNNLTSIHPGSKITNFSLTLLIIFYLQQQKIIPTINAMEDFSENRSNHIQQLYSHSVKSHWIREENSDNLFDLLLNFFKFYFDFSFSNKSICLRTGDTLNKFNNSALHIHNPFNKELNVSKNVNSSEVQRIQSSMRIAIANLENTKPETSRNWGILSILNFPEPPSSSISASLILDKDQSTEELEAKVQNNETIVQDNSEVDTNIGTLKQIQK